MNMLADSGRLPLDGAELEYRMVGPRPDAAPTLVMLHEGLGSVGLWGGFPDQLAAATGAGVFAYSRAGYGGSSPAALPRPLSYMHDEALQVLPRVLDAIDFRRGLLVGHSDGASIASIYAGSVQDHRIRGLSLLAPHFVVEEVSLRGIADAKVAYETGDLRAKLARWHGDVDNAFQGWNDAWLDPEFRRWDISEALGYLRVPVQIVYGDSDEYGTLRQVEIAEQECYCPVDVTILPGVGHNAPRQAPDDTLRAVSDFVNRILTAHGEGAMREAA
jgi:pimeloyl-ACP methyl ester carboxylesterase